MITQEILKELLHYCPETGVFTWKKSRSGAKLSLNAGYECKTKGYVHIEINGSNYKAHRLAFLYMTGKFPDKNIDHINGIVADNSLKNLREANESENGQNQKKAHKNNKSGFLGVSFEKKVDKYRALIKVNGKRKHLGYFTTPHEAHEAYVKAKRELHPFNTL